MRGVTAPLARPPSCLTAQPPPAASTLGRRPGLDVGGSCISLLPRGASYPPTPLAPPCTHRRTHTPHGTHGRSSAPCPHHPCAAAHRFSGPPAPQAGRTVLPLQTSGTQRARSGSRACTPPTTTRPTPASWYETGGARRRGRVGDDGGRRGVRGRGWGGPGSAGPAPSARMRFAVGAVHTIGGEGADSRLRGKGGRKRGDPGAPLSSRTCREAQCPLSTKSLEIFLKCNEYP